VTKKPKRRSKSVGSTPAEDAAERVPQLAPSDVVALVRARRTPMRWPEIRDLVGVRQGGDVDQLRRVLRGCAIPATCTSTVALISWRRPRRRSTA
jgi:hypothetical protein